MPESKYIEELWIGIKADYASLQAGLKASQQSIKNFVSNVQNSSEQLRKFGQTTTLISGAVAGLGLVINNVFAGFEQSMANTFSVMGATKKEMEELTKYARLMGETTIFKASEAADALYYLGSAGYNAQQSMAALKGTLDLAAATQYDLAQTTDIVVAAINSYNFEATEATRVANVFAASIAASQATMEKIGYSFAYVAPIAAGLGIRFEELTAALGVLYDAGIQASTAGTSLRQIFARLQAPVPAAIKALEKLGLTVEEVNPQFHSLAEILKAFERVQAGAIDKGDELADIFDIRSVAPFQVLIRNTSDALEIMETKITGTNKASEMAGIQINTFKGSVKLLMSALQETAIQLGEMMQPILRALTFTITNLIKAFNAFSPTIKSILVTVISLATGFGLIVGPMAILIAKIPALIAQFTALGASFAVTLGWVVGISLAITGLLVLFGSVINAQQKHNNILTESMSKLKEYNQSQIQQKEKMRDVIKAYVDLSDKQNKTTKDVDAQKSAFNKIKELYPSLISSTDDYTTAVNKMKMALGETNTELTALYEKKLKLRELELRIDVTKAKTDLRTLEGDLKNTSRTLGESFGTVWTKLDASVKLLEIMPETMKEMSDLTKSGAYNIEEFRQNLQTILFTQDGIDKITRDQEKLLENINNLSIERNELLQLQNEMSGQLGDEETKRLSVLDRTIPKLDELSSIYSSVTEQGHSQLQLQSDIIEKEAELNKLKKEGLAITETPFTPKGTPGGDLTEDEKKRVQELEREIYDLKKKSLEGQLSILEKNKDDSLEADMKYLNAKYEIEKLDTEFMFNQKKQQLVELKASQETMLDLEKLFNQQKLEQEELYQKNKKDVDDRWFSRNMILKDNEFKYSLNLNKKDLENYRTVLDNKRIELENAGKQYTAEWAAIVDKINDTTKLIEAPGVNKMQFEIEMYNRGEEGYEGEALNKYYEYLQQQLALTQEWSDEYLDILLQMERVKDEMRERELDKDRLLFFSIRDIAYAAQAGISAGFDHMWNKYIIGAREAKNELDAIWLAIRNAVLKAIADIVQAEITKLFLKIIAKIAGSLLGPIGGVAAEVATEAVPVGAVGAQVVKSGQMVVHKDEMVVPARIVRGNDDRYEDALRKQDGNKSRMKTGDMNLSIVLNNPSVDDKRYWESVIEEHIEPAFVKLKKRYE